MSSRPALVPPSPPTDDQLVARWRAGDESAFGELVTRHGPALHRFLRSILRNDEQAADVWSETFLRVVRARDRYQGDGRFRPWLLTIARRCAMDEQRTGRRVFRLAIKVFERTPADEGIVAGPDVRIARTQRQQTVDAALGRLKPTHRAIVDLTYREDLDSTEIGEILGLSAQEVRSRLTYARRLLRAELEGAIDD